MRLLAPAFALLLAAAPAAPPPAPAVPEGFAYTREVEVAAPGWARVLLDLAALQHLLPEGADLHVFDPEGRELPRRVGFLPPQIGRSTVQVLGVEPAKGGWTILLDAGAEPPLHQRLSLGLSRRVTLTSVRLEGSRDGRLWQTLAVSGLFSADPSLPYTPTQDRYLRFTWPEAAGAPAVDGGRIETVIGPSVAVATAQAHCDPDGGRAVCRLGLPAARQTVRRLILDLEGEASTVGYRLFAPRDGRWKLVTEGVWQRAGELTRHVLTGGLEPISGADLRLELSAEGETPPQLAGHGFDLVVPAVVFEARSPGRYTLAYGGGPHARPPRGELPPDGEALSQEAGPEREHPIPALPASLTAPGALLGSTRFSSSWGIVAPAARPGGVVRLEIPDAVYAAAGRDLGDLRLAVGRREIPFVRWSPPDPKPVVERRNLVLASLGSARNRQVDVALPGTGLPLTELHLTAPGPFRQAVEVRYAVPSPLRAGRRERTPTPRRTWECSPQAPLPCRETIPLPGRGLEILSLRFEDLGKRGRPPLSDVDLELWRRSDVLLFAWPAEGPVRLLAGAAPLAAPSYELAKLGDALLARPWQPAELDLAGTAAAAAPPWWSRWIRPGVLWIAAICLLLLLRRILPDV